jgi:ribosomal-protein-alanine N-acetyltransferase
MKINRSERLQGDGFHLRLLEEDEAEVIVRASRSDVPEWTYIPRDLDAEGAQAWIRKGIAGREEGRAVRFVIIQDDQLAGTVGAQHPHAHDWGILETFYFILPEFRRRGLATSSLKLLDEWAQGSTPELRRLQLHVIVGNPGSGRVAELAGYKYEGVAVHQIPSVNGYGPRDAEVYGKRVAFTGEVEVGGVLA